MTNIELVLLICVLVIPAFGVTARLTIAPTVDAIIRLREAFLEPPQQYALEQRVFRLEEELRRIDSGTRASQATEIVCCRESRSCGRG